MAVCAWIAFATPCAADQGQLSKDPDLSAQADDRGPFPKLDAVEMGAPEGVRKPVDEVLRLRFIEDYEASDTTREVFEKYLQAQRDLDALLGVWGPEAGERDLLRAAAEDVA